MTLQLLRESILQEVAQVDNEWLLLQLKSILKDFVQPPKVDDIARKDKILISKINQTALPAVKIERCNTLLQKMEFATLLDTEHQELMAIVEEEETLRTQRLKYLIELAQLRNISLQQLMVNLGLKKAKLKPKSKSKHGRTLLSF